MKVVISERYSPDAPPHGLEITIGVMRCFCRWPHTRQCSSASSGCHCLLVLCLVGGGEAPEIHGGNHKGAEAGGQTLLMSSGVHHPSLLLHYSEHQTKGLERDFSGMGLRLACRPYTLCRY